MKEDNLLLTESIKRYRWKVGPWNDCSKPCNIGTKRRAVACYDTRGNKAMLSEWICKRISRKPKDQMPCNRKPCQLLKPETNGQWIKGEWSKCSVTCDKVRFSPNFMRFGLGINLYFKMSVISSLVLLCFRAFNRDQLVASIKLLGSYWVMYFVTLRLVQIEKEYVQTTCNVCMKYLDQAISNTRWTNRRIHIGLKEIGVR